MNFNDYKTKDFDEIFCYFLNTYISIHENGRARIPIFIFSISENSRVSVFLREGIKLIEEALSPELFQIMLEIHYCEQINKFDNLSNIMKFVLIKEYIQYLFNDDFVAILQTSNLWSDNVKIYGSKNICPKLSDELKSEFQKYIF